GSLLLSQCEVHSGTRARPPTPGGAVDPAAPRSSQPPWRRLLRSRRGAQDLALALGKGALMLNQPTLEKLHALRLVGMAEAFRAQAEQPDLTQLSFEERFALLVDQQWTWKQNRALARRLAHARLRHRASVEDVERRDFLEICEDRYQMRSTILTSQLPVAQWHAQIGDPTLADSILDRLVHHAHRIEMQGESMRKKRGKEQ